jgi:hypothetical protein
VVLCCATTSVIGEFDTTGVATVGTIGLREQLSDASSWARKKTPRTAQSYSAYRTLILTPFSGRIIHFTSRQQNPQKNLKKGNK